jgi:hypothetical protein
LMTTVLQNMERFSREEIRRAQEARLFMAKNGFTTSQEAKRMAGNMLNVNVTSRDIDIADILHGSKCPFFLQGSSKWRRSPAAAVMLGPRIVQKQQA